MKKTIFSLTMLVSLAVLVSCGGKKEENKETPKDSTKTEEVAVVKDFTYFNNLAKDLKIEGLELSSANASSDTAAKWFYYGFTIKDGKDKGADKINVNCGDLTKVGNRSDFDVKTLAEYETAQRKLVEKPGLKTSDFKEYKNGSETIYYYTVKGISDQMGGHKNYNQLYATYIKNEMYFTIMVSVYDNTAALDKAEGILKQVMEAITK